MTGVEMRSMYNDGFTQFEMKKDLYKLKWLLDQLMQDSPTFVGEEEFLEEEAKNRTWRTLVK